MARAKDQSGKYIAWIVLISAASAIWQWAKATAIGIWGWLSANANSLYIGAGVLLFIYVASGLLSRRAESHRRRQHLEDLMLKYEDQSIVDAILNNEFWIGASDDMLRDSLGEPEDIDREVMKRKTKETWKYGRKRANQYRLRVFVENGVVTSW